jgi:hypothetical protein
VPIASSGPYTRAVTLMAVVYIRLEYGWMGGEVAKHSALLRLLILA